MLHVLVQKKAERDVFPAFKHGELSALQTLEKLAREVKADLETIPGKAFRNLMVGVLVNWR